MIGFCPLASGSKGNCLYLGTKQTKVLIDAGLSMRQLELRLSQINVSLEEIDAILITHEHMDHIQGLKTLHDKAIPVLANSDTAKGIYEQLHVLPDYQIFTTNETFEFRDIIVHPFSIQHDTLDPVGFVIEAENQKIGICTDLGYVSSLVRNNLKNCDYLYLEANHQEQMVHACSRPSAYKKRVLGRQGHLCNEASMDLLSSILHNRLKHIYLAHLSSECNSEAHVIRHIKNILKNSSCDFSIAYQEKISKPILFN